MTEKKRNLDELNDWLQVIATVGVIASIVFLGFELRQNSDLMRAQIYQNELGLIDEEYMEWWANLVLTNGPEWLALFGTDIDGRSSFVEEVRRIYPELQ